MLSTNVKTPPKVQRVFILGESWLYYKIYLGVKSSDLLLIQQVAPLVQKLTQDKLIDKWFFIRYADPNPHLRLRFHFTSEENLYTSIQLIKQHLGMLVKTGQIVNIQTDTYKRELERYGFSSINLVESIFCFDSRFVIQMLIALHDQIDEEELRWLYSLKAIDHFLTDFNLTLEEKTRFMESLSAGFNAEFGMEKYLKKQLNQKYRFFTDKIEGVLNDSIEGNTNHEHIFSLLNYKSKATKSLIDAIQNLKEQNMLDVPMDKIKRSLIHMMINRIFRSKQRVYELTIYYFLHKYYNSKLAREKYARK